METISLEVLSIYAAKAAVVLIFLLILYRCLGKRQVGQMNVYDLAAIMAVSNAVQNALTAGKGNLSIGLASSATLLILGWLLTKLFRSSPESKRLLLGVPVVLVSDGHVLHQRLRNEDVSTDELLAAIHQHGLESPKQVCLAVLELDGSISVVPMGRKMEINPEVQQ